MIYNTNLAKMYVSEYADVLQNFKTRFILNELHCKRKKTKHPLQFCIPSGLCFL